MTQAAPENDDATRHGAPSVSTRSARHSGIPNSDMPSGVDGHTIIREIGRGGMAVVYLAREEIWQREVALKVVPSGMAPRQLRRFLDEASITGQLQHPVIVPVYRIGKTTKGRDYYTMKRVQGQTLSEIILDFRSDSSRIAEQFGIRRRTSILLQICEGVGYAHDRGIIHRDLKPSNIMIGDYGEVYVLDWGLAKVMFGARKPDAFLDGNDKNANPNQDENDSLKELTISGTPGYMSPEQARGEHRLIDQRSDVWSLGAILYALLTYHPPITADSVSTQVERSAQGQITPPEEYSGGRHAPKELLEIASKAMKLNPSERYGSAREMAEDLRGYLDGRGSWQEEYRWECGGSKPSEEDWSTTLGEWDADAKGLFPSKRIHMGAVLLFNKRFFGDVRIQINGYIPEETTQPGELALFLCAPDPDEINSSTNGYCLELGADNNNGAKIAKDNIDILVQSDIKMKAGHNYTLAGERIGNSVRMEINGKEFFSFEDLFPLAGKRVGLYGWHKDIRITSIQIFRRRLDAKISCLALPDRDYERKRFTDALSGYLRIAGELSGWEEGWLARFKAGLCRLNSNDPLGAKAEFRRLEGTKGEYLAHLGHALISEMETDYRRELLRLSTARRVSKGTSAQAHVMARMRSRAKSLFNLHKYDFAIEFYKEVLSAEPEGGKRRLRARTNIISSYFNMDLPEDALQHLKILAKEAKKFPSELTTAYESAIFHFKIRGSWDQIEKICVLLESNPKTQAAAWTNRAQVAYLRGKSEAATQALGKGFKCKLDPEHRAALLETQARLDLEQGRLREAQMVLKEAISISENFPKKEPLVILYAWIYAMRGKGSRGLATLARYMNTCEKRHRLRMLFRIGQFSRIRGQLDYAKECLIQSRGSQNNPENYYLKTKCTFELGFLLLNLNEQEDGINILRNILDLNNSQSDAFLAKTCLNWHNGEPMPEPPAPSKTLPWTEQANYFYTLGEFAQFTGRKKEARRAYGRAIIEAGSDYHVSAWKSHLRLKELNIPRKSSSPDFPPIE